MITFRLVYSDESEELKSFETEEEARVYFHNEGDHLVYVERIIAGL